MSSGETEVVGVSSYRLTLLSSLFVLLLISLSSSFGSLVCLLVLLVEPVHGKEGGKERGHDDDHAVTSLSPRQSGGNDGSGVQALGQVKYTISGDGGRTSGNRPQVDLTFGPWTRLTAETKKSIAVAD